LIILCSDIINKKESSFMIFNTFKACEKKIHTFIEDKFDWFFQRLLMVEVFFNPDMW
jgi:hypothetical protein